MTRNEIITAILDNLKDSLKETWTTGDVAGWVEEGEDFLAAELSPALLTLLQAIHSSTGLSGSGHSHLPTDFIQIDTLLADGKPMLLIRVGDIRMENDNDVYTPDARNPIGRIWGGIIYYHPTTISVIETYYIREPDHTAATSELPVYTHSLLISYGIWKGLMNDAEFDKAGITMNTIIAQLNLFNQRFGGMTPPKTTK